MTDEQRLTLATEFFDKWLELPGDDPADLPNGNPRLACDRVMVTMALVGLIEGVELESRETTTGGPMVDLDRVVSLCVMGDGTT